MYSNDFSSHMYFGVEDGRNLKYEKGNAVILNIDSYECYAKNLDTQLSCVNDSGNYKKIKTNDTTYNLRIKRLNKKETIENGKYRIFIIGKYKNVTSTIYFDLEII